MSDRRKVLTALAIAPLAIFYDPVLKAEDTVTLDNIVDPESPQAKALGYVHHYSEVDSEMFSSFEEGQICANCMLAQGNIESDWFSCSIFQNQLVAREGWCNAWIIKR